MDKKVKIRRGQITKEYFTKSIKQAIKQGKLLPDDEIHLPNKGWMKLDSHTQLAPLFALPHSTQTIGKSADSKSNPMEMEMESENLNAEENETEEEVVDEDLVTCPKCGHQQEGDGACASCGIIISKFLDNQKPPSSEKEKKKPWPPSKPARPKDLNWFQFLWQGRYPFWITFCLFFILGNVAINFLLGLLPITSASWFIWKLLAYVLVIASFAYYFVTLVATWRSAGDFGESIFASLVKIFIAFQFVSLAFAIITGRISLNVNFGAPTGSDVYSLQISTNPEGAEWDFWAQGTKFQESGSKTLILPLDHSGNPQVHVVSMINQGECFDFTLKNETKGKVAGFYESVCHPYMVQITKERQTNYYKIRRGN